MRRGGGALTYSASVPQSDKVMNRFFHDPLFPRDCLSTIPAQIISTSPSDWKLPADVDRRAGSGGAKAVCVLGDGGNRSSLADAIAGPASFP
jgi:hypothetical protein